jgi:hypothetical protein
VEQVKNVPEKQSELNSAPQSAPDVEPCAAENEINFLNE